MDEDLTKRLLDIADEIKDTRIATVVISLTLSGFLVEMGVPAQSIAQALEQNLAGLPDHRRSPAVERQVRLLIELLTGPEQPSGPRWTPRIV